MLPANERPQDRHMIATMAGCYTKMTIASVLVLASISSASAQSYERSVGTHNIAPSYQQVMPWRAMAQVHRRTRGASARVPNVMRRGGVSNPDSNYWYERNRAEFSGRW
jgi:hypothetical protein